MGTFGAQNLDVWRRTEADAYFQRNRMALDDMEISAEDQVIKLMLPFLRAGDRVLDLGCANGWRLRRLSVAMPALGLIAGIDLSLLALQDGLRKGSNTLALADVTALPVRSGSVDCVVLGWVCYATGRRSALAVLAEVERVIREDGIVVVLDFLPDRPTENPYHHPGAEAIRVVKSDFAGVLVAYGGYQRVALSIRPFGEASLRSLPGAERVGITVLQRHCIPPDEWATARSK